MNPAFSSKLARRNLFRYGAAGLVGAGAFGVSRFIGVQSTQATAAQGPVIEDARYQGIREELGKYILLTPQKLGGGTHAVDLASQKTLDQKILYLM